MYEIGPSRRPEAASEGDKTVLSIRWGLMGWMRGRFMDSF
jgi:hypothetical protein